MCEYHNDIKKEYYQQKKILVSEAVGSVLSHDITEIRKDEFKGVAFRKGHIIKEEDICKLHRLGKEHLYVLNINDDEMHEDDAAHALAHAIKGDGIEIQGEPKEGKINLIASVDGILKIDTNALLELNMLGEIMCATLHNNSCVKKGQLVAGTRAIPLVVKKDLINKAKVICEKSRTSQKFTGIISVNKLRRFRAGVVITGNEVYYGRIKDAFAPVITSKLNSFDGEIIDIRYAPDNEAIIEQILTEMIASGADLLITTGGLSVDPDDVTRFAIKNLGVKEIFYGSAALPGAMFLVAYIIKPTFNSSGLTTENDKEQLIPVLGIPACGMYHRATVFDIILPRIISGEYICRNDLAQLGHGGLCLNCKECRYPICPFGK